MTDYKLSQLNSIDTIRSEDLLHIRVKKRPEMLGDEDRRMTYQDFLASFKLERFVQIAGSTMTGDLGIVKLLYGGKPVFDPTGSSEITIGDVLKTFKINANGLKLTIADASRSATVYHTLNKPSPNELGMRTNEENDARYARLAVTNNFSIRQAIITDGEQLTLKKATNTGASFVQGRDANNQQTWYVGQGNANSTNVYLYNHATGSLLTLDATAAFNKSLRITGQVQPSDFSNLDARYFTQTVANQRFAQLTANNTFSGLNTFSNYVSVSSNAAAIMLKNKAVNESLFILAKDVENNNLWYIGKGDANDNITFYDYKGNTSLVFNSSGATFNKSVKITGQIQPSDWTNIDSRYIPAGTLSTIARTNATNTFSAQQIINSNGEALVLKAKTATSLFITGKDVDGTNKWYIGNVNTSEILNLYNYKTGKRLNIGSVFEMNANLSITGQVQPSDFSNLDARYYTQSTANSRYMFAYSSGSGTEVGEGDGIVWNAKTGLYNVYNKSGGSTQLVYHMYQGGSSTPAAQLKFNYRNSGIWYRSARDGYGFENTWAKIYTDQNKPTPSDIGAYTKAETDQKIAQAVSDSTDLNKIYPVGIVTWFNSNVNPNTALPGLTWTYLNNGVGRTIRIAAANGSDVATTGGSDSVTLSVGNLPSHTHSFSATTSTFDYGTKYTNTTGDHNHNRGNMEIHGDFGFFRSDNGSFYTASGSFAISGSQASRGFTGNNFTYGTPVNFYASRTWTGVTNTTGNHSHAVGIGAHSHTVSGNTGGTGSGSAFSVTNQFYKLMAWVRTA